ncbi:MAG: hypothetical protein EZS28_034785 [Streblomastix strix]|uniref:Derlin n=1 Tax=Streblomastix strix TaxID=222440 RepID=A0A5J4UGI4_9EUKA|nr:MAG: hypothetical protein EZS28_034785 [Streblomastix strix]
MIDSVRQATSIVLRHPFATGFLLVSLIFSAFIALDVRFGGKRALLEIFMFSPRRILYRKEIYRLISPFIYIQPMSFMIILDVVLLYRAIVDIEDHFSGRRKSDFYKAVLFLASFIEIISSLLYLLPVNARIRIRWLGGPLVISFIYFSSRLPLNRTAEIRWYGIIRLPVAYFPWIKLFTDAAKGTLEAIVGGLIGIFAGHLLYFFTIVVNDPEYQQARNARRNLQPLH